jgi:hypothetical protein
MLLVFSPGAWGTWLVLLGACSHIIATAKPSVVMSLSSSKYDFNVQLVDAEGHLNSFLVPVYEGQRISDAADDFARRRHLSYDQIFSEKIFSRLCPSLDTYQGSQSPVIVECESADSNTIVSQLLVNEVRDLSTLDEVVVELFIYVRKGYSATQQARFACSYYDCSDAMYLRIYHKVAKAMESAAFDIFYNEPFALTEGPRPLVEVHKPVLATDAAPTTSLGLVQGGGGRGDTDMIANGCNK